MQELLTFEMLAAFVTLTGLEIVLGIDNVIFIAILTARVASDKRDMARKLGLLVAVISRIALLLAIQWVMQLTAPLFTLFALTVTGKDIVLMVGGLFLIGKATREIHHRVGAGGDPSADTGPEASLGSVLLQVLFLDIVFSLDSVITAVGMVDELPVMIAAVLCSVGIMVVFSKSVVDFVEENPPVKILALSFLVLIGVVLLAEGLHHHIPKGMIYFSMAFALTVEMLQLRMTKKARGSPSAETPSH